MTPTNVYIDIENTVTVPFLTGIQRTTIEIVTHLRELDDARWRFVPVRFCEFCEGWLRFPGESLFSHRCHAGSGKRTNVIRQSILEGLGRPPFAPLTRMLGFQYRRISHNRRLHQPLLLPRFEPGSIFLDIDSSWHNTLKRSRLLPALKQRGVTICTLHYDMIPLLMPDVAHPNTAKVFRDHFEAHLKYSSLFACISQTTRDTLAEHSRNGRHMDDLPILGTIRLGDGFFAREPGAAKLPALLTDKKYILSVGTIEPRKNYHTLLDAFDALVRRFPELCLVIVGREGWSAQDTVSRIRQHLLQGKNLFLYSNLSDDELRSLYRGAFLYVCTSTYEGFGLPISEALGQECVTISSNAGALPEAGEDYVDYISPMDSQNLVELVERFILDPEEHGKRKLKLRERDPNRWHDTARQLIDLLDQVQ